MASNSSSECKHIYKFQYVVYSYESYGTDKYRYLEDRYYCETCLNTIDKNRRHYGFSYSDKIEGSFPK